MGSFSRHSQFNKGRGFGGRDSGRMQMHKAVCSECKKDCEVPFKPTGSKPVFCRDCFQNNKGFDSSRSGNRNDRSNFDNRNDDRNKTTEQPLYKEQLVSIHAKLDKILKILTPVIEAPEATSEIHLPQIIQEEKQPEETIIVEVAPKKKRASKKTIETSN